MKKATKLYAVVLLSVAFIPVFPLHATFHSEQNKSELYSGTQTNFNITDVTIEYRVSSNGKYTCQFTLTTIGSFQSTNNELEGNFTIIGYNISNFQLYYEEKSINYTISRKISFSIISFTINQTIKYGVDYSITGSFTGFYNDYKHGVLSYDIGFDWGPVNVAKQTIIIITDARYHFVEFDEEPAHKEPYNVFYTKSTWSRGFEKNFNLHFDIILRTTSLSTILLIEPHNPFVVTAGKDFVFKITNNGSVRLSLYFIPKESFTLNVSDRPLLLNPHESKYISIHVSTNFGNKVNGSIIIFMVEVNEEMELFIQVKKSSPGTFEQIILLILLFMLIGAVSLVMYYKRRELSELLRTKRIIKEKEGIFSPPKIQRINNNTGELTYKNWQEIASKWSKLLSEKELKIIEFLFFETGANQKDIAEALGISKMSISRLITKLENKNLVHRHSSDKGNIIKLNYELV